METTKMSHLCTSCGKASALEVHLVDDLPTGRPYPRECLHCKELKSYLITPLENYGVNLFALIKRVRLLEKRVEELEEKL